MSKKLIIDFEKILDLSHRVDFFDAMTHPQKITVLRKLQTDLYFYEQNETIIKEGESDTKLFIILSGKVRIDKGDNDHTALAILEGGSFFGETSFSMATKRISSVNAYPETIVMVLTRQKFSELEPEIQILIKDKIIQKLILKLSQMNDQFLKLCNVISH